MTKKVHVELVALESLKVWRGQLKSIIDECGGVMPFVNTLVGAFPEFSQLCNSNSLLRRWGDLMTGYVSPGFHETMVVIGLYEVIFQDGECTSRILVALDDRLVKFAERVGA